MIRGRVAENHDGELEPWLTVAVARSDGGWLQCDVIVDTGFTGWLTLPEPVIRELGLPQIGHHPATVASGGVEWFDYYETSILWHGQLHWVGVFQSNDQALLGMELLRGNWINMGAWDGGDVIIEVAQLP